MVVSGKSNRLVGWVCLAVAVGGAVAWFLFVRPTSVHPETGRPAAVSAALPPADAGKARVSARAEEDVDRTEEEAEPQAEEEQLSEEERREAEEERLVEAFDSLTDTWQEPAKRQLEMSDVDAFVKAFRTVPEARKDECIHRALNLIPDENVMLLAGVLMDKTMNKEIVEAVYNDILNRDEDVKRPILQQIFKDKTHPCWTDTAWILDVTGDLPQSK